MRNTFRGLSGGRSGAPKKQPLTTMWLKNVLLHFGAVIMMAPPSFNFEAFLYIFLYFLVGG